MNKGLSLLLLLAIMQMSETGANAQDKGNVQDKGFMVSFGGATFRMDDMKSFQESILSTYPVEGKIISSFPPYTSVSFNFLKQVYPHLKIGGGYAYTSTGGKSDYSDFSGNIHTTMVALSHRLGAFVSYTFLGSEHLDLSLFGRLDANLTHMKIASVIYASGLSNGIENTYKSISPNTSTGFELMYKLKNFSIGMDGGYLVDFPAELKDKERGSKLYDPTNAQKVLTADWTGWRASIKALFWFNF